MWSNPQLKDQKLPGELLVGVYTERMKKLESDIRDDGSNNRHIDTLALNGACCIYWLASSPSTFIPTGFPAHWISILYENALIGSPRGMYCRSPMYLSGQSS